MIDVTFQKVTPGQAAEWLATLPAGTRYPRPPAEWVTAMRNGPRQPDSPPDEPHWDPSPVYIAFDEDGRLVDGKARLAAIVSAGVDVPMMIVTDLSEAMVRQLDHGALRDLPGSV